MQKEDINEIGFTNDIETQVLNMASLCKDSNLDGVVCSAQEAKLIKSLNFLIIFYVYVLV
jgi:orotidine-5'-phosphate decarboxylase